MTKINREKTKTSIFTQTEPKVPIFFVYCNDVIEVVDQYNNLNIIILFKNGKFSQAQEHLVKQANKAAHELRRAFRGEEINIIVLTQLNEKLVANTSVYGTEVWFHFNENIPVDSQSFSIFSIFDNCIFQKFPQEKVSANDSVNASSVYKAKS